MPKIKQSLQRLIVSFGPVRTAALMGLLVLASILFSITSVRSRERQALEETRLLSASYASAFAEYSELAVFGADQVLQNAVARFGAERLAANPTQDEVAGWIKGKLAETNFILGMTTISADGFSYKSSARNNEPQDRRLSPSFRFHKEHPDKTLKFWGRVYTPGIGRETIEISRRLETNTGEFAGVISGFLDPDFFTAFFRNANLPKGSVISLSESGGRNLVRLPPPEDEIQIPTNKSETHIQNDIYKRIGSLRALARYPLNVQIELPTAPAHAQSRSLGWSYAGFVFALALLSAMVVTLVRTLSKRLVAEQQIQILSLAIENSPMSVVITDAKGKIEYVNAFFTQVTGFTKEEAVGQNPSFLKSGHMNEESYARMWKAITSGHIWHGEFHNLRKDGSSYWELAAIAPIKDERGQITHFVSVKEDISLRKQAERDLLEAKEMAEEANRAKSAFLANMSHELRTPLNAVIGFADMLTNGIYGPLNDRQLEALKDIRYGGQHLLDIINDVLDMSRIEAGRYELTEEDVDVKEIIQDCLKMVAPRASHSAIMLDKNVPEHLPNVWGDSRAVKQVILNLLSNAVKFTPKRGRVSISGGSDTQGGMWLTISDTGPGISQEDLERLFQPFQQGEQWLTRQHEGTGLGLAISKRLMELHGGSIRLESTLGQGTTVWLRFPPTRTHVNAA